MYGSYSESSSVYMVAANKHVYRGSHVFSVIPFSKWNTLHGTSSLHPVRRGESLQLELGDEVLVWVDSCCITLLKEVMAFESMTRIFAPVLHA